MSLAGELEGALGGWHETCQYALILLEKTFSTPYDTPVFLYYMHLLFGIWAFVLACDQDSLVFVNASSGSLYEAIH
jgi:hypothetical protein